MIMRVKNNRTICKNNCQIYFNLLKALKLYNLFTKNMNRNKTNKK